MKTRLGQFIKRRWKILVGLVIFIVIVLVGYKVYDNYTYVTLPMKEQNEAVDRMESKLHSDDPSISLPFAYKDILLNKHLYEGYYFPEVIDRLDSLKKEAFSIIQKEEFDGEPLGQYYLGQYYCHIDRDMTKAAYWWNEAAQGGCSKACGNLGLAYERGRGVKKDMRLAVYWSRKGAEAGESDAQYNYGNFYRDGVSVKGETLLPKDIDQAKFWWRKAAEQGHSGALDALQKIYD